MSILLQDAVLRPVLREDQTSIYRLQGRQLQNQYLILSGAGTRRLMAFPEVVGYDSYLSMLPATVAALRHLFPRGKDGDVDILTILRGGLNYPVEEACARNGIHVRDMHFVSCERIIEDHIITGLEIKYEKIRVTRGRTLVIGDIIATGDTLRLCLGQVVDRFRRRGGSIRKIVFFTIGGTRAIDLMEKMADDIRAVFPEFEGFECFFYEGVFTVYENQGATGINVPDIDFGWKGGAGVLGRYLGPCGPDRPGRAGRRETGISSRNHLRGVAGDQSLPGNAEDRPGGLVPAGKGTAGPRRRPVAGEHRPAAHQRDQYNPSAI